VLIPVTAETRQAVVDIQLAVVDALAGGRAPR
jgi:hypothetical protein